MKLMDKNGRFFGKLHFLDLLVCLLVIGGVVGMALRFTNAETTKKDSDVIPAIGATYLFEIQYADEHYLTAYKVGDQVYEDKVLMGTVTEVRAEPTKEVQLKADGTTAIVERQLTHSLFLTIRTENMTVNAGYYIEHQEILNGTGHTLATPFVSCAGYVREIVLDSQTEE